jgi:TonB family protein
MKRSTLPALTFLLLILVTSVPAQSSKPSGGIPAPPSVQVEWQQFVSPDGSFSIHMPGQPSAQTGEVETISGKVKNHSFMFSSGGLVYGISYGEFPLMHDSKNARATLDGARELGLARIGAKLRSEREITFEGFPGRELQAEVAGGLFTARNYLIGHRLYSIMVFLQHPATGVENVARYFESFKLLKRPEELPPPATPNPAAAGIFSSLKKPPADFFNQPIEWREFNSAAGSFRVQFPRPPFESSAPWNPTDGKLMSYSFLSRGSQLLCLAAYAELAAGVGSEIERKVFFDGTRQGVADFLQGKPVAEQAILLAGQHQGREIKIQSELGYGTARLFVIGRRAYLLVALSVKAAADSEGALKFLNSFVVTAEPSVDVPPPPRPAPVASTSGQPLPKKIRVSGGVLQANAVKKVSPPYPPEAKADGVFGEVQIEILISETGQVVEATVLSGPEPLREAALTAARAWEFKPTELSGVPVKVQGVLRFNFTLQ